MKLAITGKGGVGKTTFTALLAHAWAEKDRRVTVIDADPSMNLGQALGLDPKEIGRIVPLSEQKELIEERTGTGIPGVFNLNPRVDDLADRIGIIHDRIRLMVMGTILTGGGGCACGANTLLRAVLSHLVLKSDEVVLVDMEAGIEHLGRRTIQGVDGIIILLEPGQRSISVAERIVRMAAQIGIKRAYYLINRVSGIQREIQLPEGELLGAVPCFPELAEADYKGLSVKAALDKVPDLSKLLDGIIQKLL
ncbi:MAG: AAA family ATPase [bacterium]